jgi:hypothetical protein
VKGIQGYDSTSSGSSFDASSSSPEDNITTIPVTQSQTSQILSFESVLIFLANMLLLLKSTADAQTKTDSFIDVNGIPESVGFPLVFANILTKLLRQKDNNDLSVTNIRSNELVRDDFVKNKKEKIKKLNKSLTLNQQNKINTYPNIWRSIDNQDNQDNQEKQEDLLFAWWLFKNDRVKKQKYFLKWFDINLSKEENKKEFSVFLNKDKQFNIKKDDENETAEHDGSDDFRSRLTAELYTMAEKIFVWFIKNICARLNNLVFSAVPAYQTYVFLPKLITMLLSGSPAFWVMAVASWIYLGCFLYKKYSIKGLAIYVVLTAALIAAIYFLGPVFLIAAPIALIAAKAYHKAGWKGFMFVALLVAVSAVSIIFLPPVVFPIILAAAIFCASWWNSKNTVNFKFDKNHQRFFDFLKNFQIRHSLKAGWKHIVLAICAISTAPFLYLMLKAMTICLLKVVGGAVCAAILGNPYIMPIIIGIIVALTVFISVKVIWERIEKTLPSENEQETGNVWIKRIMSGIGLLCFGAVIMVSVMGDYSGFVSLFKNIPVAILGALMSFIYNACSSYRLINDFSNYKPTLFGAGTRKSMPALTAQLPETNYPHQAAV